MARKKCLRILTELRFCKNRLVFSEEDEKQGYSLTDIAPAE